MILVCCDLKTEFKISMYQYAESVFACALILNAAKRTPALSKVISNTNASLMKYPFCSSFHASLHGVQGQYCAWLPLQALVGFSTQTSQLSLTWKRQRVTVRPWEHGWLSGVIDYPVVLMAQMVVSLSFLCNAVIHVTNKTICFTHKYLCGLNLAM